MHSDFTMSIAATSPHFGLQGLGFKASIGILGSFYEFCSGECWIGLRGHKRFDTRVVIGGSVTCRAHRLLKRNRGGSAAEFGGEEIEGEGGGEMEGGGPGELQKAAAEGDLERVRSLLDAGTDACEGSHEGMTPLMLAAQNGHGEVVRALLQAGAPWNALNPSGQCAGDFAMEAGHQEAFDVLLDAGMQAELILGVVARQEKKVDEGAEKPYLQQRVEYSEGKLLDEENKGVMMTWENPLMAAHAKAICANGGHVLNVGFGMGLVDTAIQSHNPASHTIIEAHPEVYKRMLETGWGEKPNVRILFGRWQDVLPQLDSYDGIFFDTYGEFYDDLKEFHEHLPKLLKKGGVYSYFNGLCATNAFFHVVYCQLVALELARLGLTTQFIPLPVKDCLDEETWRGVYHKYWQLDTYFLPVCQSEEEENEEDPEQ